jgi:hypothetical protein
MGHTSRRSHEGRCRTGPGWTGHAPGGRGPRSALRSPVSAIRAGPRAPGGVLKEELAPTDRVIPQRSKGLRLSGKSCLRSGSSGGGFVGGRPGQRPGQRPAHLFGPRVICDLRRATAPRPEGESLEVALPILGARRHRGRGRRRGTPGPRYGCCQERHDGRRRPPQRAAAAARQGKRRLHDRQARPRRRRRHLVNDVPLALVEDVFAVVADQGALAAAPYEAISPPPFRRAAGCLVDERRRHRRAPPARIGVRRTRTAAMRWARRSHGPGRVSGPCDPSGSLQSLDPVRAPRPDAPQPNAGGTPDAQSRRDRARVFAARRARRRVPVGGPARPIGRGSLLLPKDRTRG